ncbi:hypothetical protein GQ42DRAFT_161080 [Ramicandelaber brevisporus]|nr:hypothetical protein GQ42DRAFT_161080 [Ramicandelaber brevisporus]
MAAAGRREGSDSVSGCGSTTTAATATATATTAEEETATSKVVEEEEEEEVAATEVTVAQFRRTLICALPPELFDLCLQYCDFDTVRAMALTCHIANDLARPILFRVISRRLLGHLSAVLSSCRRHFGSSSSSSSALTYSPLSGVAPAPTVGTQCNNNYSGNIATGACWQHLQINHPDLAHRLELVCHYGRQLYLPALTRGGMVSLTAMQLLVSLLTHHCTPITSVYIEISNSEEYSTSSSGFVNGISSGMSPFASAFFSASDSIIEDVEATELGMLEIVSQSPILAGHVVRLEMFTCTQYGWQRVRDSLARFVNLQAVQVTFSDLVDDAMSESIAASIRGDGGGGGGGGGGGRAASMSSRMSISSASSSFSSINSMRDVETASVGANGDGGFDMTAPPSPIMPMTTGVAAAPTLASTRVYSQLLQPPEIWSVEALIAHLPAQAKRFRIISNIFLSPDVIAAGIAHTFQRLIGFHDLSGSITGPLHELLGFPPLENDKITEYEFNSSYQYHYSSGISIPFPGFNLRSVNKFTVATWAFDSRFNVSLLIECCPTMQSLTVVHTATPDYLVDYELVMIINNVLIGYHWASLTQLRLVGIPKRKVDPRPSNFFSLITTNLPVLRHFSICLAQPMVDTWVGAVVAMPELERLSVWVFMSTKAFVEEFLEELSACYYELRDDYVPFDMGQTGCEIYGWYPPPLEAYKRRIKLRQLFVVQRDFYTPFYSETLTKERLHQLFPYTSVTV